MKTLTLPTVAEQIIVFADLSGYHRHVCSKLQPAEAFAFLSQYYAMAQDALSDSDGQIVKFMGDAIMIVFPPADPDRAIISLRKLKSAIDALLDRGRYESRFRVKAHVGVVASGPIGIGDLERFDVCGSEVNQAALLPSGEWVLSDELAKRIKG